MFMVYWTEQEEARQKLFEGAEMSLALKWMEDLRSRQRNEGKIGFITMSSEIPECVTRLGVDAVVNGKTPDGNDYTWKKRRL